LRPPASIIAVAAVLLIGCVFVAAGSFYLLFANPAFLYFLLPFIVIEFALSLLGIVTSSWTLAFAGAGKKSRDFSLRRFPPSSSCLPW